MFLTCLKGFPKEPTNIAFSFPCLCGYHVYIACIMSHKLQLLLFNATTFDAATAILACPSPGENVWMECCSSMLQ